MFRLGLYLSALPAVVLSEMQTCVKIFDKPKATFDLSALYQANGRYLANDTFMLAKDIQRPYTYFFNVCGDVDEPDEVAMCHNGTSLHTAAAYQHVNGSLSNGNKAECWPLGQAEKPVWSYIAGDNAAVGVQLAYEGGQDCRDVKDKQRKFIIQFSCIHEATALPPISTVYEDDMCEYKVTMESIWGCPTECHSEDHLTVCGGHGICAVDTGSLESRCFCNEGFTGPTCNAVTKDGVDLPPPTGSVTSVLVVLVCLLLVALLGFSGVLYVKIKKLNAEDNPYGAFEDQVPISARD